jgi:hypothetical protein
VLSKSRCPHTGVVNFFTQADPLLAVGSVAEVGASARYVWRCYVGEEACGLAADMSSAEAQLRSAIVGNQRHRGKRPAKAATPTRPSRASSYWQKLNEAAAAGTSRTSTQ